MRARVDGVDGNDAGIVDHLHQDRDGVRGLHDLVVVAVAGGKHGRPGCAAHDAPVVQRSILRSVCGTQPPRLGPRGRFRLRLGRQRRNSPVARIHDERCPPRRDDASAPFPEQVVVAGGQIGLGIAVAAIGIVSFPRPFFKGSRFRLREELFPRELGGAFERRHGGVGPDALQIALAELRGATWPGPRSRRRRRRPAQRIGGSSSTSGVSSWTRLVIWSFHQRRPQRRRGRPRRPSRRSRNPLRVRDVVEGIGIEHQEVGFLPRRERAHLRRASGIQPAGSWPRRSPAWASCRP